MKPVPIMTMDQQNIRAGIIRPGDNYHLEIYGEVLGCLTRMKLLHYNSARHFECNIEDVEESHGI
jgi:hypothetical protein